MHHIRRRTLSISFAITCAVASIGRGQPTSQPATPPEVLPAVFNDGVTPADGAEVQVTTDVSCGSRDFAIEQRSPSDFVIRSSQTAANGGQYVLVRLDHVAGRTVQVDFEGPPFNKWGPAVPMYAYGEDLDAPETFDPPAPDVSADASAARVEVTNGDLQPALPDTSKQGWHYVATADHAGEHIIVRQKFEHPTAYLAFKVPYTPAFNAAFLELLHGDPMVKVIDVGQSREGRPLQIATVAKDGPNRPCVLIYARERPDDQDGSWVTQGSLLALTLDTPEMRALRDRCDFVIIPMLDPDGAELAAGANILNSFTGDGRTVEARAYLGWFRQWIASGHRVDVAIALRQTVVGSNYHVAVPLMEPEPDRLAADVALHALVHDSLTAQGFSVRITPWQQGKSVPVLSGWLQREYGTLVLPYVTGSLHPQLQLDLEQLRAIGITLVKQSDAFLASADGRKLMQQIDTYRANGGPIAIATTRPTTTP